MEEKEQKVEKEIPRTRRRVALFRRRKKPDDRPFVRATKQRHYKKTIARLTLIIFVLFFVAAILYGIKRLILPRIFLQKTSIINPQGNVMMDNDQTQRLIQTADIEASNINFNTDSDEVSFLIHNNTMVYFSLNKNIGDQLNLVQAIDRQLTTDGKRAIMIDLRYNKPIVKF